MQAVVNVVGNVGSVRVFDNEDGGKTVFFSVAVNQRQPKGENAAQLPPVWYSFRAINGLADALAQYLTKGRLVSVAGMSPRIREYETERTIKLNGTGTVKFKDKTQVVDYLVADLRFIGGQRNGNNNEVEGELIAADDPTQTDKQATEKTAAELSVSDVPF